jgi:ATP-dependent helicase HrpB
LSTLTEFPDRVARKREGAPVLVLAAGGSAEVADSSSLQEHPYYVALDVQETQGLGQARSRLKARSLCAIEPEWLLDVAPDGPVEEEELRWEKDKVVAYYRLRYGELTLEESPSTPKDLDRAARVLWKSGLSVDPDQLESLSATDWIEKLSRVADRHALEDAIARVRLLEKYLPQAVPSGGLTAAVKRLVEGHLSLAILKDIRWQEALVEAMVPDHRHQLEKWLPRSLTLPGGRRAEIHYRLDRDPWIESRLQDFFGLQRGPTILEGRLPLTLHLLAPNGRAVQVTTDLASFWDRAYPPIRKELGRKYPRHSWPENPRTAEPPKPRKRP